MFVPKIKDQSANSQAFWQQIDRFNKFMNRVFSRPMRIINDYVLRAFNIALNHSSAIGCCTFIAITTAVSATSIAVGVGVGVGVGCNQVEYITSNSTSS